MHELVQEILDTEVKAEQVVQQARAKADKIRADADERAKKIIQDTRNEVQRSSLKKIEEVRRRLAEDTSKELERERTKSGVFVDEHEAEIGSLVSEIVDRILRTDRAG
jgi:vacuolar-type H+-ATPase subunit H